MNAHSTLPQPKITPATQHGRPVWRCQGSGVSVLGETPSAAMKGWSNEMGMLRRKQALRAQQERPMATQRPVTFAHKA
jgi:hypothetical protein